MAILGDSTITTIETTEITVGSDNGQIVLDGKQSLLNLIYPVGSIYVYQDGIAAPNVCPIQTTLGGTWEKIEDRFLYSSSNTAFYGKRDGSNQAYLVDHSHRVQNNYFEGGEAKEAGKHTHSFIIGRSDWHTGPGANEDIGKYKDSLGIYWGGYSVTKVPETSSYRGDPGYPLIGNQGAHTHQLKINAGTLTGTTTSMTTPTGLTITKIDTSNKASKANMPQYFGVIAWRRTA